MARAIGENKAGITTSNIGPIAWMVSFLILVVSTTVAALDTILNAILGT